MVSRRKTYTREFKIETVKLVTDGGSHVELSPVAWSQRLGYVLELIGEAELAEGLAEYVVSKDAVPVRLSPAQSHKGVRQDMRWRLFPNEKVEPEL